MKEKDLPIDLTKHKVYSKNAQKCVMKLLRRYYDGQTVADLWEKIQLQYCEYLKEEPALKDLKITTSIYDPILIFAWHAVIPDKLAPEDFCFHPLCVPGRGKPVCEKTVTYFSSSF